MIKLKYEYSSRALKTRNAIRYWYLSQIFRNVRGILEQLRAELKREENRRNELER